MKRLDAKLLVESAKEPMKARLLLGEIAKHGALMFSESSAAIGSQVSLHMQVAEENSLYLKGTVTACSRTELKTRVLRERPLNYRLELNFVFDSPQAEQEFSRYYDHLQKLRK